MRKAMTLGAVFALLAMVFALVPANVGAPSGGGGQYEAYFITKPLSSGTWGPYTRLSYTPTDTRCVMVAADDDDPGHLVVVYADNLAGQYDWYYRESFDFGTTWTPQAIAVDPSFEIIVSDMFSCAIDMGDNGYVHMVFCREKQFNTNQPVGVYYARFDGTSWTPPIIIKENLSPGTLWLYTADITVGANDDTIHIAYGSDYPGNDNGDTWYSRSTDGGNTWSTPVNINQDPAMDVGYRPSLAADSIGNVYKCNDGGWPGYMWFRRSATNGFTWNPHQQIGNPPLDEHRRPITMCDDEGNVYIVYAREAANFAFRYKYSNNNGITWIPSQTGGFVLSSPIVGMGYWYLAELDDYGYIHIAYGSTATGVMETYYMKIDTQGNIIDSPQIITPDDGNPSYPNGLDVDDDQVYITTKDYVPLIEASIEIHPETLNLKSKGKWVTCIIELPEGYDYMDIDPTTVYLEGDIPAEKPVFTGHSLNVKFDRSALEEKLSPGDGIVLTVTGQLNNGIGFTGTDTIRAI
ncbi:MAG: exo-alpha-sialidase [Methanomassiliicoccales archaeon]|nr:MAG: exo-alpha-sialidase [Methanomassiliicoccales archaeon]